VQLIDYLKVFLASPADAQKADADALIGAQNSSGAGGGQGQRGRSRGRRFQEIPAMNLVLGHSESTSDHIKGESFGLAGNPAVNYELIPILGVSMYHRTNPFARGKAKKDESTLSGGR